MKFKVRIKRKYSIFITILACAMSIWMMVQVFDFPMEELLPFVWICLLLLGVTLVVAAFVAFITRWIADRRK